MTKILATPLLREDAEREERFCVLRHLLFLFELLQRNVARIWCGGIDPELAEGFPPRQIRATLSFSLCVSVSQAKRVVNLFLLLELGRVAIMWPMLWRLNMVWIVLAALCGTVGASVRPTPPQPRLHPMLPRTPAQPPAPNVAPPATTVPAKIAPVIPSAPAPVTPARVAAPVVVAQPPLSFERYGIILTRMPFGDEAAAAALAAAADAAKAASVAAAESFAKNLKMCAITRNRFTDRVQVGLLDTVTKKSYFMYEGDKEDGMELVVADYEKERAMLKKDGEEAWMDMNAAATGTSPGTAAAPVVKGPVAWPVARRDVVPQPTALPKPRFTGEALEKHLKEYQMDLIRAGGEKGPPLPMELTPEMDSQLVKEGVLPPTE